MIVLREIARMIWTALKLGWSVLRDGWQVQGVRWGGHDSARGDAGQNGSGRVGKITQVPIRDLREKR